MYDSVSMHCIQGAMSFSQTGKNLVFLTKNDIHKRFCLSHVGAWDGTSFCLGIKAPGFMSCGVTSHRAIKSRSLKFDPPEDHFWIPGLMNFSMPTALKTPSFHFDEVPPARLTTFCTAKHTTKKWLCIFIDTTNKINDLQGDKEEMDDDYEYSSKMEGIMQRAGYEEPRHQGRNCALSSDSKSSEEDGINLSNSSGYCTLRNAHLDDIS
jgi:hypothetical protein